MRNRVKWIAIAIGVVVLLLLPLGLSPFNLLLVTEILLMGLFALSLNLLFGYTGLLSFGHAAHFATRAYGGARSFAGPIVGAGVFLLLEYFVQSQQRYLWEWLASFPMFPDNLAERQLDLWNFFLSLLLIPLRNSTILSYSIRKST